MKYISTILFSLAATANAYTGHGQTFHIHERQVIGDPYSQMQCWEVQRWGTLVDLANNQTRLDRVSHGNSTIAAAIQAKAAEVKTQLDSLNGNRTLTGVCDRLKSKFRVWNRPTRLKLIANVFCLQPRMAPWPRTSTATSCRAALATSVLSVPLLHSSLSSSLAFSPCERTSRECQIVFLFCLICFMALLGDQLRNSIDWPLTVLLHERVGPSMSFVHFLQSFHLLLSSLGEDT